MAVQPLYTKQLFQVADSNPAVQDTFTVPVGKRWVVLEFMVYNGVTTGTLLILDAGLVGPVVLSVGAIATQGSVRYPAHTVLNGGTSWTCFWNAAHHSLMISGWELDDI